MFTKKEIALMRKLNTPAKVQDFLNTIPFNFETRGETLKSPVMVLRGKNAHCMEGAILGAYLLSLQGHKPFVLHLEAVRDDYDHVIAPFKLQGLWGALSKTNHAVLRYREPVYKSIRELVMSYFHEYFLNDGKKTLRRYSDPLNLNFFGKNWTTAEHDLWEIDKKLDRIKHFNILPRRKVGVPTKASGQNIKLNLRKADKVEIKAGKIVEWER